MSNMLSSWKEIAQFFGKGVRTVQRWEKTLDLPIHRPPGAPSNVVLAKESDLEAWMNRGLVGHHESHASSRQESLDHSFEVILAAIEEIGKESSSEPGHSERVDTLRSQIKELERAYDRHVHNGHSIAA